MQLPIPVLFVVMILFVPFSPRGLVLQDRYDEAGQVLVSFHESDQGSLDRFTALGLIQKVRSYDFNGLVHRDDESALGLIRHPGMPLFL
jgi:hypothetical protein